MNSQASGNIERSAAELVARELAAALQACQATKPGDIVVHLTDGSRSSFALCCEQSGIRVQRIQHSAALGRPLLEITSSSSLLRAVLARRKNPLKLFALGRLRVRGDLRYLSSLGVALDVLKKAL